MKRFFFALLLVTTAAASHAQVPAKPPPASTANVEVDPIRCWWRTSAGAVRVGETFDLSLTCALLDNPDVQVVADESHLGSAVVAMAPFEVVGGTPPSTLRSGQRRFFQYQYTLRIINPDAIGKDVQIPDMVLHYKVNSRVAANTSLQGRDLIYILPIQLVRVTSMVPADATDIRDATGERFDVVDSLLLRAGTLEIVALACTALGALMVIVALVRIARRSRVRTTAEERVLSPRRTVSAALRELAAVERAKGQEGWTDALAGRALTATRIAAAVALGRPVNQRVVEAGADGADRLLVRGFGRGKAYTLSSPVTAGDVARRAAADPSRQYVLDELRDALTTFSETQYGREPAINQSALDAGLSSAMAGAGRVKAEHSWLKTALRQLMGSRAPVESRA